MKRTKEVKINPDNTIHQKIEDGKVLVLVLDGVQGKAKICEAVEHGFTIIETAKGKAAKIKYEESELF